MECVQRASELLAENTKHLSKPQNQVPSVLCPSSRSQRPTVSTVTKLQESKANPIEISTSLYKSYPEACLPKTPSSKAQSSLSYDAIVSKSKFSHY